MEYLKTDRAFFFRKIHFCPNLGKKGPKWPQNRAFWTFWKILWLVFLESNPDWKLILSLIFYHQSHIYQVLGLELLKCSQPIKLQDSLKCNIARKKWIMKFISDMEINIEVFYKLILAFWVCLGRHAQSTQNKKSAYFCNIFRKMWEMRLIFCLSINANIFYKLIVSLVLCIASHAQCNQGSKFAISLQYLKENVNDKVDILLVDKHQGFLQIDTIILDLRGQICPNYPK